MYKIGFFGDGIWAEKSLRELLKKNNFNISFVCLRFSSPDKNLIKIAKKNKIKTLLIKKINLKKNFKKIKKFNCDLLVSMSYDQIFGNDFIKSYKNRIINCHAGDLPFYRGRSVLNWVLVNDEKYFGITVHFIDKKIDTGDIILKKKFIIKDSYDFKKLKNIASINCSKLLLRSIKLVLDKKNYFLKQNTISKKGSYFRRREPGDEIIHWQRKSRDIFSLIRAICRPSVVARGFIGKKTIFINKSSSKFLAIKTDSKIGTVISKKKNYFIVKTLDSNIKITDWTGSVKKGDRFKVYENKK